MPEHLHLIVTGEGDYGHSVVSPQMPGFIYGRPGTRLDRKDLKQALKFANAPDLPWVLHQARHNTTADGLPYSVRVCADGRDQRFRVGWQLEQQLDTAPGREMLASNAVAPGDEVQFVVVLDDDLVGWMVEQIDERPERFVMVMPVDDESFRTLAISSDAVPGWSPIDLPATATLGELMAQTEEWVDRTGGVLVGA